MKKISVIFIIGIAIFLGCSSTEDRIEQKTKAVNAAHANIEKEPVDGAIIFKQYCILCHGAQGNLGTNGAKDLRLSELNKAQRIEMISNGKGLMTPFKEILSAEEIEAVAEYTFTLKND